MSIRFLILPVIFLAVFFTSCTQGKCDSSLVLKLPDKLVRDIADDSVQNGHDFLLKICLSGEGAGNSVIEKTWNLTLDSLKENNIFYIEELLSDSAVNIDIYFLIDGQIYYQSETTKVNLSSGNNYANIILNRVKEIVKITSITLSRNHFLYTEGGCAFDVNVSGYNFDLIDNSDEDKKLVIQIVDESGNVTDFNDVTVNKENNTASASLTLPSLSSATAQGTNYTVRVKAYGYIEKTNVATFNISNTAEVTRVSLSSSSFLLDEVSGKTTTVTVKGTNFDLAENIKLAIYNSEDTLYGDTVIVDTKDFTKSTDSFDVALNLPTTDDSYTVKVFVNDDLQNVSAIFSVYGDPSFTSFTIPEAGTGKKDNYVTAVVTGKNFFNPRHGLMPNNFTVSCDDATYGNAIVNGSTVTLLNNKYLEVTLCIPEAAGEYKVTITCNNKELTSTFTVKEYSSYAVGDIILSDVSKVDVDKVESYTADENNAAVGVVAFISDYGIPFMLGLQQSSSRLAWAASATSGYNTCFEGITVIVLGDIGSYDIAGDTDGSDNWDYIKSIDTEGTSDDSLASNYPAFNFAVNYGTSAGLSGDWASGWYMPSIDELYRVYQNKDTISISLTKVGGSSFEATYYWSSSQSFDLDYAAFGLDFANGSISNSREKSYERKVLVLRRL
jgi:hypothetical protein